MSGEGENPNSKKSVSGGADNISGIVNFMARIANRSALKAIALGSLTLLVVTGFAGGLQNRSAAETDIGKQLSGLRSMADADRSVLTKKLALQIRALPAGAGKAGLANSLANLATEGDFGRDTLQEVTTTLAVALTETPSPRGGDQPYPGYDELAQLAKYEHMNVSMDSAEYRKAVAALDAVDDERKKVDFTLSDLAGHPWTLSALKGKVVLVNFWATWCPPCRKEMPDLQTLYNQFKSKGFVILSISDEDAGKVNPFVADHKYSWPILLDPGRNVNQMYRIQGIPKSFLYDRKGHMIAQTIDMRTKAQFLDILSRAGLK